MVLTGDERHILLQAAQVVCHQVQEDRFQTSSNQVIYIDDQLVLSNLQEPVAHPPTHTIETE